MLLQPLLTLLSQHAAVGLLGPRQVGKTTLALVIAATRPAVYLDLEAPSHLAKLAEPELYLAMQEDKLVILDEIQRLPTLLNEVHRLIEERQVRFLLTGSSARTRRVRALEPPYPQPGM